MPYKNNPERPWMKKAPARKYHWGETKNGVAKNFYRNAPWRKLRKAKLEKDPICEHCYQQGKVTPATVVDHTKPVRLGGEPLDIDNTTSLCVSCHNRKSASSSERYTPTPKSGREG
ncbi:HNH endonuclease [Spirosoma sp. BT702]|uniref:Putative HNH nuclease YajD n=1 Tax=Spirosoma profusum TaxID=2771354 RepID=A0A926Y1D3_9BACT|nr:HNH endonuclease signature motif containing protein [Spirosoma profusum]MBD2704176.1 HNH endonuclease [Spirosoma profusum]